MKKYLHYQDFSWSLNIIVRGLGVQVVYPTKPTRKQIRRQTKALQRPSKGKWGASYNRRTGRFE